MNRGIARKIVQTLILATGSLSLLVSLGPASTGAREKDIHAEAAEKARRIQQRLGEDYQARQDKDRRLVYVSALDDETFARTARLLAAYLDAQRKTLLTETPEWYVTVVLPTVEDYEKLAGKLYEKHKVTGYYNPLGRKLTSIDRGRVLIHEFTHALHHADTTEPRQVHALWVNEGLATLFEAAYITPGGLEPFVDLRVLTLQKACRKEETIPLKDLFEMGHDDFMKQPQLAYAQSRYVMLYLWQNDKLQDWYERYKKTYVKDPTGRKALEAVLGNRLPALEPRWLEWAGKLKLPKGELQSGQGRLGLAVKDTPDGVEVTELVENGPAEAARRIRVGDRILQVQGREVANSAQLFAVIRQVGALRTVTMRISRAGRKLTIRQPLGAPESLEKSGDDEDDPEQDESSGD